MSKLLEALAIWAKSGFKSQTIARKWWFEVFLESYGWQGRVEQRNRAIKLIDRNSRVIHLPQEIVLLSKLIGKEELTEEALLVKIDVVKLSPFYNSLKQYGRLTDELINYLEECRRTVRQRSREKELID